MSNSQPSEKNLLKAAEDGRLDIVKRCIQAGVNVNCRDEDQGTPVYWAATGGHQKVCQYLFQQGAELNVKDVDGSTPLIFASFNGHSSIVSWLLAKGCNVNDPNNDGYTPLHTSSQSGFLDVIKELVKNGADVNAKNKEGATPLSLASQQGQFEVVKLLIDRGADVNYKDRDGATPLHLAARGGNKEECEYLVKKGADLNVRDVLGNTPFKDACFGGHSTVVTWFLTQGCDVKQTNNERFTPLHSASQNGSLEVVKLLLTHGADINSRNNEGARPLQQAARNGHSEICEHLVQQGAELKVRDVNGYTPLRNASFGGHSETVRWLLSKGLPVGEADNYGFTPLHVASSNGFVNVVEQLLDDGADINVKNNEGGTPLHFASKNGHPDVVTLLTDSGAEVNCKSKDGATPLSLSSQNGHMEVVKLLTERGANVNSRNEKGATPLDSAAYLGLLGMCKYFYSKGADIHSRNSDGRTSFHWACVKGHLSVMGWILSLGFDVNETSNNGWTGLHEACNVGELKAVQYLIESKAKVDSKDKNSKTPMQLAEEENHTAVVEYLNSYMKTHPELAVEQSVPNQDVTSHYNLSPEGNDNGGAKFSAEKDKSQTSPHNVAKYDSSEMVDSLSYGVADIHIDDSSHTQTGAQIDEKVIKELQEHFEQQKDHTEKVWSETDKQHLVGTCLLHVLLAGESEFGKTSIARSLMLKSPYTTKEDDRTRVLDYWSLKIDDNKSATLYDLGGHSSYRVLSHLFHHNMPHNLTMIPHDITNTNYSITCHWLTDILTRSPKMQVWILLTKSDLLDPSKIEERKAAFLDYVCKYLNDQTESLKNKTGALANISQSHVDDITKKYKSIITELKTGKILHLVSCKQEEAILNLHSSIANLLKEEKFKVFVSPSVRELYVQIGKLGVEQAAKRLEESKQKDRQKLTQSKNTELSKTNQSQPLQGDEATIDESKEQNDKPEPEKPDDNPEPEKLAILQYTKFKDLEVIYEKILSEKDLQPKTSLKDDLKEALKTLTSHGLILWYEETDKLQEFIFNDIRSFVNMLKSLFDHTKNNLSYDKLKNINVIKDQHNLSVKRLFEQGMMELSLLRTLISQFSFQHDDVLVDLLQHLNIAHKAQGRDFIFFPWYLQNPDNTNDIKLLVQEMKKSTGGKVCWHICIEGTIPCAFYHGFCVGVYKDLFINMDTQKREMHKHYLSANIDYVDILIEHDKGENEENKINIYLKSPVCEKQFKNSWTFMHECEKVFKLLTEKWWHGSGLSIRFKCPDCPLSGYTCNFSWPLHIITPEVCQSGGAVRCETNDIRFPAALVYPLYPLKQEENKDDTDRIAKCIKEVKEHVRNTASLQASPVVNLSMEEFPTDTHLHSLAAQIGNEKLQMAAELYINVAEVEQIERDHPFNSRNQNFQILRKWRDRNQQDAVTKSQQLQSCMHVIGREQLVKQVKEFKGEIFPPEAMISEEFTDKTDELSTTVNNKQLSGMVTNETNIYKPC